MQLPKVSISRTWGDQIEIGQFDLPESYMDIYKKLLGDAKARVSVSADMSLKEFGSGAGAMVTVTLSCNQDAETIEQAIDLAGKLAREYCVEHQKLAEQELMKSRQKKSPF
jgi:hypothetical protein